MLINQTENNEIELAKSNLCKDFYIACKPKNNLKIGIELERLPIYKKSFESVPYFGNNGLYRLMRQIAYSDEWAYITDSNFINGLKKGENTITLEPGGQIEYSLTPEKNIFDLKTKINNLDRKLKSALDFLDISLLEYPITPVTSGLDIEIIPKRRYQTMAKYMPGSKCFSMMRETAGIQVAVDYINEFDAIKKLKTALMLSPFMTAIFANSPIRCGKMTGFKSYRASAWLKTDESRCGLISEKLLNNQEFAFQDYIQAVFEVPMLFIKRYDEIIEIGGKINFEQFLMYGYKGFNATKEDYQLHASLFFPEVRLKNIIEIRNHDCLHGDLKYAIPAMYKGLLYNNSTIEQIFELLKDISFLQYKRLRSGVAIEALQTKIGLHRVSDYAKDIVNLAYKGLKEQKTGEEKLIEPIIDLVYNKMCPADIILKNWHKKYHYHINELIQDLL